MSMSLRGGIDMYAPINDINKRYKLNIPPKGRKVYFLNNKRSKR